MAYSETVAQRVRDSIGSHPALTERKMFGGIAFLIGGNMACGVTGDNLMLRVGKAAYADLLLESGVRPFDMTGKEMKGWVLVTAEAYGTQAEFDAWVQKGVDIAEALPSKY